MDIQTNYENKIKELSNELIHCIEQYNLLLKKEKEKKTSCQFKEEKRKKNPREKELKSEPCD